MIPQAGQGSRKGWLDSQKSWTNGAPKTDGKFQAGNDSEFFRKFPPFSGEPGCILLGLWGGLESCCSLDLHISKQSKASNISQKNGTFQPIRTFFPQSKKNWKIWSTFANLTHFYKQYLRIDNTCVREKSPIFHFSVAAFFLTIQLNHWGSQTHSYCIFALWEVVLVAWVREVCCTSCQLAFAFWLKGYKKEALVAKREKGKKPCLKKPWPFKNPFSPNILFGSREL